VSWLAEFEVEVGVEAEEKAEAEDFRENWN